MPDISSLIGMGFPNWIKLISSVGKLNIWLFDAKQQFGNNEVFVSSFPNNLIFSSVNANIWLMILAS